MKKISLALFALICGYANAADFKTQLNGKRLLMDGAGCAGISLKKNAGLLSEMGNFPPCKVDLPTRVRWLDNSTFVMIETVRSNETSPPRNYIYKVKSISGNKAIITSIWTGWNNLPDDDSTYTILK